MKETNLELAIKNRQKRSDKLNVLLKLQDDVAVGYSWRDSLINAWPELGCQRAIANMAIQNLSMQIEELNKEFEKL